MELLHEKFIASSGICTDSRNLSKDCMFVCLKGDLYDANSFVEDVLQKGARYVITSRTDLPPNEKLIIVPDPLKTFQDLAYSHRKQFNIPVIAIGGSNGKTTTKELVAEVLAQKYNVLKTERNLNNHVGIPTVILQLSPKHEIAVIEIGANHVGEHAGLIKMVEPTHVLVTNNGLDHLEGFGSYENVRKANAEIYEWARAHKAFAFVDNTLSDLMKDSEGLERVVYDPSGVLLDKEVLFAGFVYKGIPFTSKLAGAFNAVNILAAITIGEYFAVPLQKIIQAIENYQPALMRSQMMEYRGAPWLVDCYNANPSSMKVAIESFMNSKTNLKKALILGGMRELGTYSKEEHQKLVNKVKDFDLALLVFVGDEFSECKIPESAKFFKTSADAKKYLDGISFEGMTCLIKGSRGIKMEVILGK